MILIWYTEKANEKNRSEISFEGGSDEPLKVPNYSNRYNLFMFRELIVTSFKTNVQAKLPYGYWCKYIKQNTTQVVTNLSNFLKEATCHFQNVGYVPPPPHSPGIAQGQLLVLKLASILFLQVQVTSGPPWKVSQWPNSRIRTL